MASTQAAAAAAPPARTHRRAVAAAAALAATGRGMGGAAAAASHWVLPVLPHLRPKGGGGGAVCISQACSTGGLHLHDRHTPCRGLPRPTGRVASPSPAQHPARVGRGEEAGRAALTWIWRPPSVELLSMEMARSESEGWSNSTTPQPLERPSGSCSRQFRAAARAGERTGRWAAWRGKFQILAPCTLLAPWPRTVRMSACATRPAALK